MMTKERWIWFVVVGVLFVCAVALHEFSQMRADMREISKIWEEGEKTDGT